MSIDALKSKIPDYAKDVKLNLSSLAADETLSAQQLWGCFLASALASRNAEVIRQIAEDALDKLSETAYAAAQAAAAIMAQNNVYYRFVHLASSGDYKTLPAKLRMNVMANPGVEKADFELWSLAVSAINGCGMCIDSHEAELRKHGISSEQVQTAVRVAATVHAVACVLDAENSLSAGLALAA